MKIKKIISSGLILILALSITACGFDKNSNAGSSAGKKVLNIAIQPAASYAPLYVIKNNGWLEQALKKYGVTVKWTEFESGPPENESFASGQQDIGVMGDVPAIVGKASGQNTTIFGIAGYGPKAFAILVPKNSKISNVKQLKGKKVGFVVGSYAHHLLDATLTHNNMTLNDVSLVNLGVGDMKNALATGQIDAAVIWEPNITIFEQSGTARVLSDGTGILRGELTIVGRSQYLKDNPQIAKVFLEQYARGNRELLQNTDKSANLIAKDFKLTPDQVKIVLKKYTYPTVITKADTSELKDTVNFLKKINSIKNNVNIDTFVDDQHVKSANIK